MPYQPLCFRLFWGKAPPFAGGLLTAVPRSQCGWWRNALLPPAVKGVFRQRVIYTQTYIRAKNTQLSISAIKLRFTILTDNVCYKYPCQLQLAKVIIVHAFNTLVKWHLTRVFSITNRIALSGTTWQDYSWQQVKQTCQVLLDTPIFVKCFNWLVKYCLTRIFLTLSKTGLSGTTWQEYLW